MSVSLATVALLADTAASTEAAFLPQMYCKEGHCLDFTFTFKGVYSLFSLTFVNEIESLCIVKYVYSHIDHTRTFDLPTNKGYFVK